MGMRIKVAAGFVLDVAGMNTEILHSYDRDITETLDEAIIEDLEKHVSNTRDIFSRFALKDDHSKMSLDNTVAWDDEFGIENKVIFMPPGAKNQFYRSNDLLDAFQYESRVHYSDSEWMIPTIDLLPGCLYPYLGLMRKNPESPYGVEEYQESCWADQDDADTKIPRIPMLTYFQIKHLKLVPEDQLTDTFLSVRPAVMRWWS